MGGAQRVMGGRGEQRTGDSIPQPSGSIVSGMGGGVREHRAKGEGRGHAPSECGQPQGGGSQAPPIPGSQPPSVRVFIIIALVLLVLLIIVRLRSSSVSIHNSGSDSTRWR